MKRDWSQAHEKVGREGRRCRVCKTRIRIECAHIIGREHDREDPLRGDWLPGDVVPDRIIPLCGPATDPKTCHGKQHAHRLELLPYLTIHEQLQAVADAGGIEQARIKLIPTPMARVA